MATSKSYSESDIFREDVDVDTDADADVDLVLIGDVTTVKADEVGMRRERIAKREMNAILLLLLISFYINIFYVLVVDRY